MTVKSIGTQYGVAVIGETLEDWISITGSPEGYPGDTVKVDDLYEVYGDILPDGLWDFPETLKNGAEHSRGARALDALRENLPTAQNDK